MRRADSPGKFEGELKITEILWNLSGDGSWFDDEVSIPDGGGFWGLIRGAVSSDILRQSGGGLIDFDDIPTTKELEYLSSVVGVILHEDSLGFVFGTYYEKGDEDLLEEAWNEILEMTEGEEEE